MSDALLMPALSTFTMDEIFAEIARRTAHSVLITVRPKNATEHDACVRWIGGTIQAYGLLEYARCHLDRALGQSQRSPETTP